MATVIDLQVAYFLISVDKGDRNYLRKVYQYVLNKHNISAFGL